MKEQKYPLWIPSRRAKKWAGWGMWFVLEMVGIVAFLLTIGIASYNDVDISPQFLMISTSWCFGTPVCIIALAHLFLGIDAAAQAKETFIERKK